MGAVLGQYRAQRGLNGTDVLVGLLTAPTPSVPRSLRTAPAVH